MLLDRVTSLWAPHCVCEHVWVCGYVYWVHALMEDKGGHLVSFFFLSVYTLEAVFLIEPQALFLVRLLAVQQALRMQ